jgi:hypothetical protein
MLVACRLAGLSALEKHYAGIEAGAESDLCVAAPSSRHSRSSVRLAYLASLTA